MSWGMQGFILGCLIGLLWFYLEAPDMIPGKHRVLISSLNCDYTSDTAAWSWEVICLTCLVMFGCCMTPSRSGACLEVSVCNAWLDWLV